MEKRLDFLNQDVVIYDGTLTEVLHKGKFIGINDFGHARLLQEEGKVLETMEGRMRRPT